MVAFLYIGLFLLFVPIVVYGIRMILWIKCTVVVDAVIKDIDSVNYTHEDVMVGVTYYPVYKYTYNNQEYEARSGLPLWGGKKKVLPNGQRIRVIPTGEHIKLHINPNKPKQFIRFDSQLLYKASLFGIIGLIFIIIGIVVK